MLLKHHDNVIFYIKTVYFFIHLKNETIVFPFFSSVSFLFVIFELRFTEKKNGSHCEANDYTSLDASIISWQPPTSDVKLSLLLSVAVIPIAQ